MSVSRRSFLGASVAAGLATGVRTGSHATELAPPTHEQRYDPWIEVVQPNLQFNVDQIRRLAGERPIMAVVKNNAYGLGLHTTARLLEPMKGIMGFAVVKTDAAIRLRDAGVTKPVLLMGMCSDADAVELARRDVSLSIYTDGAAQRLARIAAKTGRPVAAHLYFDTGLGRMGMPFHRAKDWLSELAKSRNIRIEGSFMAFTEEADFDPEQLRRFQVLVETARKIGVDPGRLHAASSNGVYHLPDAHLDFVRPGIALYGAYPSRPDEERAKGELRSAVRLCCRVVRVEKLRKGDSVGYGRKYVAGRPIWVATLPAGHVDGVPRTAVEGARALVGKRTYPIIGAVSASHCIIEVGPDLTVKLGDIATLVGPDNQAIYPNAIAKATGTSVYDILMHLNPDLPRRVVGS